MKVPSQARMVFVAAVAFAALVACTSKPVDPCEVHPTRGNFSGDCVEFDGEACDEDPCDADDLFDHAKPSKVKASTKPAVKPSTKRTR